MSPQVCAGLIEASPRAHWAGKSSVRSGNGLASKPLRTRGPLSASAGWRKLAGNPIVSSIPSSSLPGECCPTWKESLLRFQGASHVILFPLLPFPERNWKKEKAVPSPSTKASTGPFLCQPAVTDDTWPTLLHCLSSLSLEQRAGLLPSLVILTQGLPECCAPGDRASLSLPTLPHHLFAASDPRHLSESQ